MAEPTSRQRGDRTKNLVGFIVGGVRYALDIFRVREITNPLPMVELPHAPPAVIGVADIRGDVVPVIDLRRRFGLAAGADHARVKWIVVRAAGRTVALAVDAVTEVFGTSASDQRSVPELGSGGDQRGIAAVYAHQGRLTFVVDVDRLGSVAADIDVRGIQLTSLEEPGS